MRIPTRAAVHTHPKEKVPLAIKKPANGSVISHGIGGNPKLEATIRARTPGIPTVVITPVTMVTTVPISENDTRANPPRFESGSGLSSRGRVEEQSERRLQLAVRASGDALEFERRRTSAARDRRTLPAERDGERDPDL